MIARRPIRILHLRSSPFFGSPEKMILSRIRQLPTADYRYAVGVFDEQHGSQNDFHRKSIEAGAATLLLTPSMSRINKNIKKLKRYVRDQGIHIVCSHDFKANFYAFCLRLVSGTRAVGVFHGRTMKDRKVRLYYLLDALIMATMDAVICVSESQRRSLGRLLPERKIHFIPNAVDMEEISRLSDESITGLPNLHRRTKWIVFVGRLSKEKGIPHLIRAFSRLPSLHGQVSLLVIGDGPDRAKLESLTDSLRMTHCVHFTGFQTNVYPYIRNAEFLILPSLTEGMPVVILEAFALQKPVVATRVGGIPGVVQNAKHGLLVEARNETELGNAIARLITEADLTKRMGTSACNLVKMEYTFSIQAKRYQALYREVLA